MCRHSPYLPSLNPASVPTTCLPFCLVFFLPSYLPIFNLASVSILPPYWLFLVPSVSRLAYLFFKPPHYLPFLNLASVPTAFFPFFLNFVPSLLTFFNLVSVSAIPPLSYVFLIWRERQSQCVDGLPFLKSSDCVVVRQCTKCVDNLLIFFS